MNKYGYHTVGSKYEETENLDIKEIAKLVRKDIKSAFPTFKFSVTIERYAMGQALHVVAKDTGIDRHTEEGKAFVQALRQITDQYNYDDSDTMQDYHHVRFYCHPRIDS